MSVQPVEKLPQFYNALPKMVIIDRHHSCLNHRCRTVQERTTTVMNIKQSERTSCFSIYKHESSNSALHLNLNIKLARFCHDLFHLAFLISPTFSDCNH